MKKFFALVLAVALVAAITVPALATYTAPAEIANAVAAGSAFENGTWPLPAGQYDPNLDGVGMPSGTVVYAWFVWDWVSDPVLTAVPGSITGYTRANSVGSMAEGQWTTVELSGFRYLLIRPAAGVAAPTTRPPRTGDNMSAAIWTAVAIAAIAGVVIVTQRKRRANNG